VGTSGSSASAVGGDGERAELAAFDLAHGRGGGVEHHVDVPPMMSMWACELPL
jgi:hypothetical protein